MSELREDFRSTAEDIARDAQEIERIEEEKVELDPADPRAAALSAQVEGIAEQLHHKTLAEQDLVQTAAESN